MAIWEGAALAAGRFRAASEPSLVEDFAVGSGAVAPWISEAQPMPVNAAASALFSSFKPVLAGAAADLLSPAISDAQSIFVDNEPFASPSPAAPFAEGSCAFNRLSSATRLPDAR